MKARNIVLSLLLLATAGTSFAVHQAATTGTKASSANEAYAKLASKKGAEFDRAFLEHMSRRINTSARLANLASKKAEHPELKNFAKKIRASHLSDLKKIQELKQKLGYAKKTARKTPKSKPPTRHIRAQA